MSSHTIPPDAADQEIINNLLQEGIGRKRAEEQLFNKYAYFIRQGMLKFSFPEDDAFTVYADTIISAIPKMTDGGFEGRSSLKTWLYQIFHNKCVDLVRKKASNKGSVHRTISMPEFFLGMADSAKSIIQEMMDKTDRDLIKKRLSEIGENCRQLLSHWAEGFTDKEIAAVLTYVRQAWGNKAGEISEAQALAGKKEFASHGDQWTAEEIKSIPVDAKLEGGGAPAAPAATQAKADSKPADTKPAAAPPAGGAFDIQASIAAGKGIYMATCFACHQATGLGVPSAFPPLVGTPYIIEDDRRLVAIVLKGIVGAITVDGKVYATGMPNPMLTFPQLKDDKNVADVLNYVRNSFGNKNERALTPDLVGKVRAEFAGREAQWTEAELLKFPAAK